MHFPIALLLIAALAELVSLAAGSSEWHLVAVASVRAGAVLAVVTAGAGWLLALGLMAALVTVAGHFGAVLVWGADFLRP